MPNTAAQIRRDLAMQITKVLGAPRFSPFFVPFVPFRLRQAYGATGFCGYCVFLCDLSRLSCLCLILAPLG